MKKKLAPIFAKNASVTAPAQQPAPTDRKIVSHFTRPMAGY